MIRKSLPKDTQQIMDIWLKANIIAHPFLPKSYWNKNYNTVKNDYLPIAETSVFTDTSDNTVAFISIIDNEYIGGLFVDPNCQGNGIGRQLLGKVQNDIPRLRLAVYKKNKGAIRFYEKNGFKIIKAQLNSDSGEEEYIMQYSVQV